MKWILITIAINLSNGERTELHQESDSEIVCKGAGHMIDVMVRDQDKFKFEWRCERDER